MTTIAFDGKTLAADRRAVINDMRFSVTKLRVFRDGSLCGHSGDHGACLRAIEWLDGGFNQAPVKPVFSEDVFVHLLVIGGPHGLIVLYEKDLMPIVIEYKFAAIGSGRDYAMAAMHLGKTAKEAVEVSSVFDVNTGDGVDVLELGKAGVEKGLEGKKIVYQPSQYFPGMHREDHLINAK